VAEFRERNDFEGFRQWCEYKSYEQARRDWNAIDTFSIIAKKLNKDLCEVLSIEGITENALIPIIHSREAVSTVRTENGLFKEHITRPSQIQEKAIEVLLPKIQAGTSITQRDSLEALREAKGEKVQKIEERKKCAIELMFNEEIVKKLVVKRNEQLDCSKCALSGPCGETLQQLEKLAQFVAEVEI